MDLRRWSDAYPARALYIPKRKLLSPGSPVFAIGSCFADEIRKALRRSGFCVLPDYQSVVFDRQAALVNTPITDFLEHYDTFVIRQEFERAFRPQSVPYWEIRGAPINKMLGSELVYQDYTRRRIYGASLPVLEAISNQITSAIRDGIERASLIVITLGLTEVWCHKESGLYLCQSPGSGYGGGEEQAEFRQSGFVENYENVKAIIEMILARYPTKNILLTVSPVALNYTFAKMDVITANTESKSILRAVAGQVSREYPDRLSYFPSYEMAMLSQTEAFKEDGRHVRSEFADRITSAFQQASS